MGRSKMQINKWWQASQWNAQGSYGWKTEPADMSDVVPDKADVIPPLIIPQEDISRLASAYNDLSITDLEFMELVHKQYLAAITPPTIGQDSALEAGLEQ